MSRCARLASRSSRNALPLALCGDSASSVDGLDGGKTNEEITLQALVPTALLDS